MEQARDEILAKIRSCFVVTVPESILASIRLGPPSSLLPSFLDLIKRIKVDYKVVFDIRDVVEGKPDAVVTIKGYQEHVQQVCDKIADVFYEWVKCLIMVIGSTSLYITVVCSSLLSSIYHCNYFL